MPTPSNDATIIEIPISLLPGSCVGGKPGALNVTFLVLETVLLFRVGAITNCTSSTLCSFGLKILIAKSILVCVGDKVKGILLTNFTPLAPVTQFCKIKLPMPVSS